MRLAARFILVPLLILSIGAQWMFVQGAAWVGMAVAYSAKEGSLIKGLTQAFDGQHPCPLCKAVERVTSDDDQDPAAPSTGKELKIKQDVVLGQALRLPPPTGQRRALESEHRSAPSRSQAPPSPPPRAGATA